MVLEVAIAVIASVTIANLILVINLNDRVNKLPQEIMTIIGIFLGIVKYKSIILTDRGKKLVSEEVREVLDRIAEELKKEGIKDEKSFKKNSMKVLNKIVGNAEEIKKRASETLEHPVNGLELLIACMAYLRNRIETHRTYDL